MPKIESQFIKDQYRSGLESYRELTTDIGLWASEKHVFLKYLKKNGKILDLGCGTGRTTFALHNLGYKDIIGVDLTPEMIAIANELNTHFNTNIKYQVGDATCLELPDAMYDAVIFSFNGIMSIPNAVNRNKAMNEIHRVLKDSGIFIFTTHDREKEPQYFEFWKAEKQKWDSGLQNPTLYEYGDIIANSKNETKEIFIHIPDKAEVNALLKNNNLELIDTFYRSDTFTESEAVKAKSGECRFWVARK